MTAREPSEVAGPVRSRTAWEATSDAAPPPEVTAVLMPGERPLWATTISSTGSASPIFRAGLVTVIAVCLLALFAPWGQSVDTFCPPDELRSCQRLYYYMFLGVFIGGFCALGFVWTSWKARYRPWLWHCAVTTTRALLVDGRGPRLAGAVDLSRQPPLLDAKERLAFGKKPIRLAIWGVLPLEGRRRALYWARKAHEATAMDDPK